MSIYYKLLILPFVFSGLFLQLQSLTGTTSVQKQSIISEEILLNSKIEMHSFKVHWLGNDFLLLNAENKIEIFDVEKNQWSFLGEGFNCKPSPDGKWVAYMSPSDNTNQIWVMQTDGTQKQQLTFLKDGFLGQHGYHYNFAWSLDSSQMAFYINPVRGLHLSATMAGLPPSAIHVTDLKGNIKEVHSDFALINCLSWHPDGQSLLMTKIKTPLLYEKDSETTTSVQELSLLDGFTEILAKFNGLQQFLDPQFSHNGQRISLLYCAEDERYNWLLSLGILAKDVDAKGLPVIKQLTHDIKLLLSSWDTKGSIYATRTYGPYHQIYKINSFTEEIEQVINTQMEITDLSVSADGLNIAYVGNDPYGKTSVILSNSEGSHSKSIRNISRLDQNLDQTIRYSEVKEIEWETVDYPVKLRGLLFLPNNYQEGTLYPLIVDVHGGGSGANISLFYGSQILMTPLEWQFWTGKGYAVFVPEMRSSADFGWLAIARDDIQEHNIIHCDMLDILTGVDELIRQGIVDNDRLALIGHSAGARRANWFTVATNRFKAIVSHEGWVDEWIDAQENPLFWDIFGGSPEEVPENYQKNSARFHLDGAATPTLFLMGNPELGGHDPHEDVYMLYESLKERGVSTEYVHYLDEGHVFTQPENRKDALKRTVDWIDRYIGQVPKLFQKIDDEHRLF